MTRSSVSPLRTHRTCTVRGGTIRFDGPPVLSDIDLSVGPDDRLAVIGDNGSGKSTLLRVLAGTERLSAGERDVDLPGGVALAEQHPEFDDGATVADAVDHLLGNLRDLESTVHTLLGRLAEHPDDEEIATRLGVAIDRFEARDGYLVDQRVDAGLAQLGLGDVDRSRPVATLSGGERTRLALAAALASNAELLLLDEPTNDLDDDGVEWLESKLVAHRGALVVVTHDRAFLDKFADEIVCVDGGRLRRYGDGYRGYLVARAAERRAQLQRHEAWVDDLERNRKLLDTNAFRAAHIPRRAEKPGFGHGAFRARNRDHGAVGRMRIAKAQIARLTADPVAPPPAELRFSPDFGEARSGTLVATVGAGLDRPSLAVDDLVVEAGDRWLITGPNGAGKTTLLRLLAGELQPDRGTVAADGTRVGQLRQDLRSPSRCSVADEFAAATGLFIDDARCKLADLGLFDAGDFERSVADLSVGQRRRLELAIVLTVPSDVLLLDEPTNHLAPELVEQLEAALVDYPGAVLTVTHDRWWRRRASSWRTLRVDGGLVNHIQQ